MSISDGEDEREGSSSPPARRAILEARDQFWRAADAVRLGPVPEGGLEERGRGVVRARYWASFTAFGRRRSASLIRGKGKKGESTRQDGCVLRSILSQDPSSGPSAVSAPCDLCRSFLRGFRGQHRFLGTGSGLATLDLGVKVILLLLKHVSRLNSNTEQERPSQKYTYGGLERRRTLGCAIACHLAVAS